MADTRNFNGLEIAVIGLACRFPGANNRQQFWNNLKDGLESITFFSDDELRAEGVPQELIEHENYVKAGATLDQFEYFDDRFFGYSPKDALVMDPQVRLFHEVAWEAMEDAGYVPDSYAGLVGVFAGASSNYNWNARVYAYEGEHRDLFSEIQLSNKDFLASRISYKFNLKGPSLTLTTACSTSLTAIHAACRSLLSGECDMAIAGGCSILIPHKSGYLYEEGHFLSKNGQIRAFDEAASGILFGNGVGVVVLKPLENALADKDHIWAIIKGSAVNNDGNRKAGYMAPSVEGQKEVIQSALQLSDVEPESISYVETHGTGTQLGDSIEFTALKQVFRERQSKCVLGSVKNNIGMFALDGKIATVLLLVSTLTLYVNAQFAKSVRRIGDQLQQQLGIGTERLSDFLAGLPVVKMFHLHNVATARYTKANEEVASSAIKQGHKHALLEGTNFFIQFVSFGGMLVVGIMLVAKQMIGLGVLVAMIQQQMLVTLAFLQLGHVITTLQGSLAGASRIVGFLQEPLEPDQYPLRFAHADDSDSMLKMEQVVFGYTADTKVLDGVSLHIGRGQMAALVGTSGGGKSTVMKLLLGYYPPAAGSLFLMGKPLGQYSIAELRSLVAYVPQDAFLFEGTIAENIRYGCQDATEEDVVRACKAAYAHDFILELPDGYQTRTGERGAKLSGGQRQRIAIARAILKNAPILLLDEATSALDAESEYWVQQALAALMKEKTVLVIAHRLSTVEHADIIYVLHEGKVVEQGRHAELLAQNGLYASMYEVQQRKDLPAREWSQSSAGLA